MQPRKQIFYLLLINIKCLPSHFSHVQLFATLWTVACQALLSMGFSRQEYWSGLPFSSPGDLPDPSIKPRSPVSPALAEGFFTTGATWKAHVLLVTTVKLHSLGLEDRGWVMVGRITSFFSSFLISSSLLSPFLAPAIQPPIHSTLRLSLLYAVFFGRKEALGTVTAVVFSYTLQGETDSFVIPVLKDKTNTCYK